MPTNKKSRLPVLLKDVEVTYKKPERRNDLVNIDKYDAVDDVASNHTKLGTNGIAYVNEDAFPELFQLSKAKAAYVYENQIPSADKRDFDGKSYAHSSAVVGLLDKKAQEVRNADTQALLQYGRDSLLNISDSSQAQDLRRKCDIHTDIANVQQNDNVRGELVEPHSTLRQTQGERFYHQIKVR